MADQDQQIRDHGNILADLKSIVPGTIYMSRIPVHLWRRTVIISFCIRELLTKPRGSILIVTSNEQDGLKIENQIKEKVERAGAFVSLVSRRNGQDFKYHLTRISSGQEIVRDETGVECRKIYVVVNSSVVVRGMTAGAAAAIDTLIMLDGPNTSQDENRDYVRPFLRDFAICLPFGASLWIVTHRIDRPFGISSYLVNSTIVHRYFPICDVCCAKGEDGVTSCCHVSIEGPCK